MENSNPILEKRKHPRFCVDLPLEYRVTDAPHAQGGLVVNVSERGFLIYSVKDIPLGTKLNIAVLFPKGFELANFDVLAEVVWKDVHLEENWKGYQFGLQIIQILEEDYRKLKQLLNERDPI